MSAKKGSSILTDPGSSKSIETQAALERRVAKLHAICDGAFTFVGLLAPEGRLLDANRRALDFAGITLSDVAGQLFWETPWWQACETSREKLKTAIAKGRKGEFSRFEAIHRVRFTSC